VRNPRTSSGTEKQTREAEKREANPIAKEKALAFPWFGSSGPSLDAAGEFLSLTAQVVAPRGTTLDFLQNVLTQVLTYESTQAFLILVE
jgi:hypothetical protein